MEEDNNGIFRRMYKALRNMDVQKEPKRSTVIGFGGPIDFMSELKRIKDKGDYYRIFLDIPAVRGAVDAIVNAVTGNGYKIKTTEKGDPETENPKVIEITKWLEYPNKDFYSILRTIVTNLIVTDDSFIESKPNADNLAGWMWPLDNRYVKVELANDKKSVARIIYTTGSDTGTPLVPTIFVHASMNKLGSSLYGISSIESIVKIANMYNFATAYNTALFEAGGVPAVIFNMKSGPPANFDKLVKMLDESKTGRSLAIYGDIDIDKIGVTDSEINFQGIFDHVTQMVMSVFQVPPVMMSLQGASTKETSKSELNAFGGKVRAVQYMTNNIATQLIHKIWGEGYEDIRFVLNLYSDPATMGAIHKIYLTTGAMTPNEVRATLDLPKVKWGDAPYNPNFPHPDTGILPTGVGQPGAGRPGTQTGASGDSPSGNTDKVRPDQEGSEKPKKSYEFVLDDLNIYKIAKTLLDTYKDIYDNDKKD